MNSRLSRFIQRLSCLGNGTEEESRNHYRSLERVSSHGCRYHLERCFCLTKRDLTETQSNRRTEEKNAKVQQCPICLDDMRSYREEQIFYTSIVVETVKCGHKFHLGCIREWFMNRPTCPLCRSAVEEEGGIDITNV